jgi:hypothetical protein
VSGHVQPWYYSASLYRYRRSIVGPKRRPPPEKNFTMIPDRFV